MIWKRCSNIWASIARSRSFSTTGGGMIGTTYAARHPERIARLVVTNTAAFGLPSSKRLPRVLGFCRRSPLGGGRARAGCERLLPGYGLIGLQAADAAATCGGRMFTRTTPEQPDCRPAVRPGYSSAMPGDPGYNLVSWVQERLYRLGSVPMLILWGMKDFVFDYHFLEEWQRRFPAAQVHRLPGGRAITCSRTKPIPSCRTGRAVSRGPARHSGACRLSRNVLLIEPSNVAAHLVAMAFAICTVLLIAYQLNKKLTIQMADELAERRKQFSAKTA